MDENLPDRPRAFRMLVAVFRRLARLRKATMFVMAVLAVLSTLIWFLDLTGWVSFQISGTLWFDSGMYDVGSVLVTQHSLEVQSLLPGGFWPRIDVGREYGFLLLPVGGGGSSGLSVRIPWWPLMVLFGVYPAISFVRTKHGQYQQAYRAKHGQCLGCGYNLTGNESRKCPECGKSLPAACSGMQPAATNTAGEQPQRDADGT